MKQLKMIRLGHCLEMRLIVATLFSYASSHPLIPLTSVFLELLSASHSEMM